MAIDLNMKILVVDDYKTMLRILTNLLEQLGFNNVLTAENGQEALQKLHNEDVDFVISDWNMEPMTGMELLREIRESDKLKNLPFIMVSAENKTEAILAAKQAGVSNYIVKPFNADTLQKEMASVLGSF